MPLRRRNRTSLPVKSNKRAVHRPILVYLDELSTGRRRAEAAQFAHYVVELCAERLGLIEGGVARQTDRFKTFGQDKSLSRLRPLRLVGVKVATFPIFTSFLGPKQKIGMGSVCGRGKT